MARSLVSHAGVWATVAKFYPCVTGLPLVSVQMLAQPEIKTRRSCNTLVVVHISLQAKCLRTRCNTQHGGWQSNGACMSVAVFLSRMSTCICRGIHVALTLLLLLLLLLKPAVAAAATAAMSNSRAREDVDAFFIGVVQGGEGGGGRGRQGVGGGGEGEWGRGGEGGCSWQLTPELARDGCRCQPPRCTRRCRWQCRHKAC
jgi:hypothetical protein